MAEAIKFVPLFPLIGVIINSLLSFGSKETRRQYCGWIAVAMAALAFGAALVVASGYPALLPEGKAFLDVEVYRWLDFPGSMLSIPVAFRIDGLSILMTLIVTGVGTLIHIFSVSYMSEDPRFGRFFIYLNLFLFSMLLLVLANNYVLMFVGWEGVGLCSYLLIGYYFEKVSAAQAGKKAFLINRVGDFGMLLGMFALFSLTGSLVFNTPDGTGALDQAGAIAGMKVWGIPAITFICLCFFLACTGKSAQLPLYVWLPDAMEGPTPVSALIHAATMVTAGVYLIARSAALFGQSAVAQNVVVWIGTLTAIWAAVVAVKQYDIKRVLAYSTVSQLGFMFAGVGTGEYAAGVSHLATHAFFKALMFLGAGAVMHALEGQLDMRKMGNIKKHMPVTFGTFAIGWYCICGLPGGSGFFSKDQILEGAFHHGFIPQFAILVFTAGLTAFYMSRMFFTVFLGNERIELGDEGHGHDEEADHGHSHTGHGHGHDDHGHSHAAHGHGHHGHGVHVHPETALMNGPLIILGILSIVGAAVVFRLPGLIFAVTKGMVPHVAGAAHGGEHAVAYPGVWHFPTMAELTGIPTIAGTLAAFLGVGLAWAMRPQFEKGWDRSVEKALDAHDRAYEGALHAIFVNGGTMLSNVLFRFVDRAIIDNLVNLTGTFVDYLAESLRTLQTGYVRNYALVMLAGAVFVVACFMLILQQLSWNQWRTVFTYGVPILAVVMIGGFFLSRRSPSSAE